MSDPASVADAYFAAVTAHDAEAVTACFADDAELVTGGKTYRGVGAIRDFYGQSINVPDLRPSPGPYVVDGDQLAVEIELSVAGMHLAVADFFTIMDGEIRRLVIYGLPTS